MGFFDMPRTESAEDMLEKFRVRELVEYERFCRDNALWDSMLACFAQDSRVEISWYQGSGQGFVEASKKMKAKAPHKLNNTLVWLNGTHAASVTMGSIHIRRRMGGTWVDLVSQVRFLYTARKEQGVWKIVTMNCIYEQEDMVDRYLDNGKMYVLDDNGVKCECVITDEENDILEIKNIATVPEYQGKGYAKPAFS